MGLSYKIQYTGSSKIIKRIVDRLNHVPTLGTTHDTAYYGDYGQTAYEHSQITEGNPHNVTLKDLGIENIINQIETLINASGSIDRWTVCVEGEDANVIDYTDDEILFSFIEDALIWS